MQHIPSISMPPVVGVGKRFFGAEIHQFGLAYMNYLYTGKGNPELYNLITQDSLQNGFRPFFLTAEQIQEIKEQ